MIKRTKRNKAKILLGLLVGVTLAGSLGVATVMAASGGPQGRQGAQSANVELGGLADLS